MGVLKFGCKFSGEASLAPGTGEDWDPNPPGVKGLIIIIIIFYNNIIIINNNNNSCNNYNNNNNYYSNNKNVKYIRAPLPRSLNFKVLFTKKVNNYYISIVLIIYPSFIPSVKHRVQSLVHIRYLF